MHDGMLAAALDVSRLKPCYNPTETRELRQERYQARNTPYPSWYLFGSEEKQVSGLVELYTNQGFNVSLSPESCFIDFKNALYFDVQFCTVSDNHYQDLLKKGAQLYGYLPEAYSSKIVQAEYIFKQSGFRFLPLQRTYHKNSLPILPESPTEAWIVKSAIGSAGVSPDGIPYTVWTTNRLKRELQTLIHNLPPEESIIVSEFIHTDDPYAGYADHVVHKAHFYTVKKNGKILVVPYGTYCQKFVFHCNREKLYQAGVLSMGDYIGSPEFHVGQFDTISTFDVFIKQLSYLGCSRIIFSADFIIPVDGIPRFLEFNKIGATFAEKFHPGLPAIIDMYPQLNV
jgi:hypothetical protein